jgi:hypothetical protein
MPGEEIPRAVVAQLIREGKYHLLDGDEHDPRV